MIWLLGVEANECCAYKSLMIFPPWVSVDLADTEKVQVISDHINHSVFPASGNSGFKSFQARYYLRKFCPVTWGKVDKNASNQWWHKVKLRPEPPTQWQGHCVISHTVPMQRNVWFNYQKNDIKGKSNTFFLINESAVKCSSTMLACFIKWLGHFLKDYFYRCNKPWVAPIDWNQLFFFENNFGELLHSVTF